MRAGGGGYRTNTIPQSHATPSHYNPPAEYEEVPTRYRRRGTTTGQCIASTKKHLLQKRRELVSCCLELALPVIFVIGTVLLWLAFGDDTEGGGQFISYSSNTQLGTGQAMQYFRTNMCYDDASDPTVIDGLIACSAATYPFQCLGETRGVPVTNLCYNSDTSQFQLANTVGGLVYGTQSSMVAPWSIDDCILLQWAAKFTIAKRVERGDFYTPAASISSSGKLYWTPNTATVNAIVDRLNTTSSLYKFVHGGVMDDGTAEAIIRSTTNEGTTWGMVTIDEMSTSNFRVQIRLNHTAMPQTTDYLDKYYRGGVTEFNSMYLLSGFYSLQTMLSKYFLEQVVNTTANTVVEEPFVAPMPYTSFKTQSFLANGGQLAPLIIVLGFLYPVSQLAKRLVLEKERRIREAMLIMGLSNFAFYFAWLIVYFVQHVATSIVITIILKETYLKNADGGIIFFCFFFFQLSTVTLSGFVSSFFSKSRIAALVTPLIYFVTSIPLFAIEDASSSSKRGLLIISPTCFSMGIKMLFDGELGGGLGSDDLRKDDPSILAVLVMLFIDTLIYLVLWLYVDAVMPNEWGTPRGFCYCFTEPLRWLCCSRRKYLDGDDQLSDGRAPNGVYEDVPDSDRTTVKMVGLRKEFRRNGKKFTAVNNLHWSMEEGQISVLLGHNGAGKSTAMNMLTGMLDADEGDSYIYGHSVRHELRQVRQEIGYCPQHNVLWPELTCEEHLNFFAAIKGLSGAERDTVVTEMLRSVDLEEKRHYASSALSGGQKRKLCVAIAFVGGSRLIFLDEPTAGMDVGARRHTWDLLQRMASNHTILLTTHFMDEADLLGQKIAILSNGSLQCSGSSLFLKSRLGVGYSLVLSVTPNVNVETVSRNISRHVSRAEVLSVGAGEISFRIPSAFIANMGPMLADLERHGSNWGVNNFTVAATTLEEIFLRFAHAGDEEKQDEVEMASHRQATVEPVQVAAPSADCVWSVRRHDENDPTIFASQMKCMLTKRFRNSMRDRRTQCLQIICPVVCILLAMLFTLLNLFDAPAIVISSDLYGEANEVNLVNCSTFFDTSIPFSQLAVTAEPAGLVNAIDLSTYLLNNARGHGNIERYGAIACTDDGMQTALSRTTPVSIALYNMSTYHELSISVFNYFNALYRKTAGSASFMTLINNPMPKTDREQEFADSIQSILIGIIIMIPFTFIPSTFVAWVVKERECKARHLQNVSGLRFSVYWLSNFVFDLASFAVTIGLTLIVFAIFDRKEYIGADAVGGTIVLLVLYGLSGIGFAYAVSFLFDEHSSAQNTVMLVNFITGFLLVLVVFILSIVDTTKDASEVLAFIFRVIPSYALGDGIINLSLHQLRKAYRPDETVWDLDVIGWDLVYMAIEVPVMLAITLFIDHPGRRMRTQMLLHNADKPNPEPLDNEDDDVRAERNAVADPVASNRSGDLVLVQNLRKEYPNGKVAVRNLSFGVRPGEVFGFLGTNGAGKTTTISILCQEFFQTSGRASIAGHDIVTSATEALRCIGYCPQFDALLDLLTVEEHLYLYAGVRGIVSEDRKQVVDNLAALCELSVYMGTLASQLSGGNKRKLSVALSLIGGPRVVFLDEPSAGMDPLARRGLWTAISNIAGNCSVVLTTHHLEEVEALAHRVAIMVEGSLHCIGTKSHLKHKFGSGFEMHVKLAKGANTARFESFMLHEFPDAKINERHGTRYNFALPQDSVLSRAFTVLDAQKGPMQITDYSVSQTSIEQVFLRISMEAELSSAAHQHDAPSATPSPSAQ